MFSSRADIHKHCPTFEQDASCIRAGVYLNIDGVRTMVVSSGISRSECQGSVQGTNTFASCVKENEVSPRQDRVTWPHALSCTLSRLPLSHVVNGYEDVAFLLGQGETNSFAQA